MNERFDEYFDDLNVRLAPHFELNRRKEVLAELRSHVTYSARDAQEELGLTLEEATKSALRAIGPVESVAEDLVRQHRGGTAKSVWRVLRVPLALYVFHSVIFPVIDIAMRGRLSSPSSVTGQLYVWLPTTILIAFGIAVWKSRRWLIKPMAMIVAAAYFFGMIWTMTPAYRAMVNYGYGNPQYQAAHLKLLDAQLEMVNLGGNGYLTAREKFKSSEGGGLFFYPEKVPANAQYRLPFAPISVPIASAPVVRLLSGTWDPGRAENWNRYGAEVRGDLLETRQTVLQGAERVLIIGGWGHILVTLGIQMGAFSLINLGVLAASNRRRRRRIRRDPHLA